MASTSVERVIVIGAGPMGLAVAHHAQKQGYGVEMLEADDRPGGMAAHFDFDGLSIERFYHFCCLSDQDTLDLLDDAGLTGAMKWVSTKMGYFLDGRLIRWGDPVSLLAAPGVDPVTKFRYGMQMFTATKRSDWERLDKISARDWFIGWSGERAYDKLWRRLLELKFYHLAGSVSAAWIWQRIKRLGNSRKSLFEEQLGYIEGGSETLMNALADMITERGGQIHYKTRAERFVIEDGQATVNGKKFSVDVREGVQVAGSAPSDREQAATSDSKSVKAQMPGAVIRISVSVGDSVAAGALGGGGLAPPAAAADILPGLALQEGDALLLARRRDEDVLVRVR